MTSKELERSINTLSKFDLIVKRFSAKAQESLQIVFDHTSYPGVEAHLFTIADAASWHPELTLESDVLVSGLTDSWNNFHEYLHQVMENLEQYRQGLKHGIIPTSHWVYHEFNWYRENWEGPPHEVKPAETFLHLVDESIQPHIKALNCLGFLTTQSCSGLPKDHTDREAYQPYVMFDERIYPRSSAHLFTIADIAGWIPSYGPHRFDVELRLNDSADAERFWDRLVSTARAITAMLHDYRAKHGSPHSLKGAV
ncbi:MAG: hypothetical protein ACFFEE_03845 [Candidatus Thorarchaeota archaeon]